MGGPLAFPATAIRSVPSGRIVGRSTTGTGRAELLTAEQLRELCSLYSVSQVDSALAAKVDSASALNQVFSGTITWTGTTAPSGTATTRYSWTRVGKIVFFHFRFSWTVAGTSLTVAQWIFPNDFPIPDITTGQDPGEIYSFVSGGGAGADGLGGINAGFISEARLQIDAGGNPQVRVRFPAHGNGSVYASGVYRCV